MKSFDYLILGQGLAGTALAWQLLNRGCRVCVIDREDAVTSSKIAAGLMTPITGQRLVKQERWSELLSTASAFYRRIEAITNSTFFIPRGMVRLFASEREWSIYSKRLGVAFAGLVREVDPPLDGGIFLQPLGAFEMPSAAQLLCDEYLIASRNEFCQHDRYIAANVNRHSDIIVTEQRVSIPSLGIEGNRLISCLGFAERDNTRFAVDWQAAKGEILTLKIPDLKEERIVNRGVWLVPIGNGFFRAGSTYEWTELDTKPTPQKRAEIETRLRSFMTAPFEVVEQSAAVRPILIDQKPVVGYDLSRPRIAYFNGLGSKGALFAPWLAERLAESLICNSVLPKEYDLRRFGGDERCHD